MTNPWDNSNNKWHYRFLSMAEGVSEWSKDPSRGVGCVITSSKRLVLATGFNGLPRGIEDKSERLERPVKYDLIVHAELNALIQCARNGVSTVGATIYSTFFPCIRCTVGIIQSGAKEVVSYETPKNENPEWIQSINKSYELLNESGIKYQLLPRKPKNIPDITAT